MKINTETVFATAEIHLSKLAENLNLKIGGKFKFKNWREHLRIQTWCGQ
jgi:hypothetical protein